MRGSATPAVAARARFADSPANDQPIPPRPACRPRDRHPEGSPACTPSRSASTVTRAPFGGGPAAGASDPQRQEEPLK